MVEPLRLVMPERDEVALARYVRTIADLLGLRDYTVEVEPVPPENGDLAECITRADRALLRLRFCDAFEVLPPEEQRYIVVHELLHPHFSRQAAVLGEDLKPLLSDREHTLLWSGYVRQVEHSVDTLATALSDLLPLPEL